MVTLRGGIFPFVPADAGTQFLRQSLGRFRRGERTYQNDST